MKPLFLPASVLALLLGMAPLAALAQEGSRETEPTHATIPVEAEPGTAAHGENAEHASSEGHDEHPPWYWSTDLWKVINLLVILAIGMRFGLAAIGPALQKRSMTIRTELDTARTALEAAEKRFDDAEFRLARLHDEVEELRQDGRKFAQADRERILANARAAAEVIGQKNREQIGLQTELAKRELRQYMAELVVGQVRQELQRKVDRQGDAPFVRTILEQVEALPAAGA